MKFNPSFIPYTKINSRWIEDLNLRPKTITLLEKNMGGKLQNIGFSKDFLDMTPKAQTTRFKKKRQMELQQT